MYHTQKLVLLPLEDWEKIKDKHMKEVKQVTVPLQKVSEISSSESANSIISKRDGENFEEKSSGEEIEMDDRVSDSWEK